MDNKWNVAGLIIEGISGTGKTTLLNALVQSESYVQKSYLSSIVLSEHQTQRVLEQKQREKGLAVADNLQLLDFHVSHVEGLKNQLSNMQWCRDNQTNMRILYIWERFHFTHVYHYDHLLWSDVRAIDSRLTNLNCKLCLLTSDRAELEKRLFTGRDSSWYNYLKRYGDSNEDILDFFINQQRELIDLSCRTGLETLILDTSHISIEKEVSSVLDFWGSLS